MEGVGSEAASLAGHLGLGNLCWIYDNNHITIEGSTSIAFTEDVIARFIAYRWNVMRVGDANDTGRIEQALRSLPEPRDRPTLIVLDSHIGYGAPHKHDTAEAHGEPLGEEEVRAAKRSYGWPEDAHFLVPPEVYEDFARGVGARGAEAHSSWLGKLASYRLTYPALAAEIDQMQRRDLPEGWDRDLPVYAADQKGVAGRDASGAALNAIARNVPWFLGGSADLGPSNRTTLKFPGAGDFQAQSPGGRNLHFGIREHAMAAICNGLALSKLRPFAATYFIFSDYARPALRLAALMELPVIFVFTHEAMSDGEDGPTHQPIEQLVSLRAMPGLTLFRPADANEVIEAYRCILKCAIDLRCWPSRGNLCPLWIEPLRGGERGGKGAYVLADADGPPQLILIATGSEVSPAIQAYETLRSEGVRCRVVSMPSWDLFEQQSPAYRESVLPSSVTARLAIEQGSTLGWERYVGPKGRVIGMHTFGGSAPLKALPASSASNRARS